MSFIKSVKDKNPQERAIYNSPDNVFNWSWPQVPRHKFIKEKEEAYKSDDKSLLIPLDISDILSTPYPATIPSILARYVRLKSGDPLTHKLIASGEIYYVIKGFGKTKNLDNIIDWSAGDVFCLPGGFETIHHSLSNNAILFSVTNEPILSFEKLMPALAENNIIKAIHWTNDKIISNLEQIYKRPKTKETAGVAIQFSSPETLPSRNTIPMINTALNTLEAGGNQRSHRHNGAAITLAIQADNVYSKIEDETVNWENGVALITPGSELHSHHNRGSDRMMSFVVQDEGLHFYLRTTGFSWD
jgi:gentisate 1,2-dioxygenase